MIQTAQYADNRQAVQDVSRHIRGLGDRGAEIVCLPEQWLADNMVKRWDSVFSGFAEMAKEFSMCIIPGAFYHARDQDNNNNNNDKGAAHHSNPTARSIAAPVILPDGTIAGEQEKIHPFEYENKTVTPGSEAKIFDVNGTKIGIMICHDAVFAAVAWTLARKGAQVILAPSRIVIRGIAPWHTYIHARTLENRIPIMAANVAGGRFGGCSMITALRTDDCDGIATVDAAAVIASDNHNITSSHILKGVDLHAHDAARRIRQSGANPFV